MTTDDFLSIDDKEYCELCGAWVYSCDLCVACFRKVCRVCMTDHESFTGSRCCECSGKPRDDGGDNDMAAGPLPLSDTRRFPIGSAG